MRRVAVLLALAVVAVLAAVGCGSSNNGSSSSSSSSSASSGSLSAADIQKKSVAAMEKMNSAAVDMQMSMKVKGDTSKITDAQAKALLGSPVNISAKGDVSNEPQKLDMTVDLQGMGQTFTVGIKMDGETMWVQFMDKWYSLPKEMLQGMAGATASPSAAEQAKLTDAIKQLGIDPQKWVSEWTLAGEETLNGASVYHLTATVDTAKMATDLSKLTDSVSGLGSLTGGTDSKDIEEGIKVLEKGLKDVTIDEYIQKDNFYMAKMDGNATLDFAALPASDRKGAEGIESLTLNMSVGMSNFDEPVDVQAPKNAKSFQDLMNDLMQSGALTNSGISL